MSEDSQEPITPEDSPTAVVLDSADNIALFKAIRAIVTPTSRVVICVFDHASLGQQLMIQNLPGGILRSIAAQIDLYGEQAQIAEIMGSQQEQAKTALVEARTMPVRLRDHLPGRKLND